MAAIQPAARRSWCALPVSILPVLLKCGSLTDFLINGYFFSMTASWSVTVFCSRWLSPAPRHRVALSLSALPLPKAASCPSLKANAPLKARLQFQAFWLNSKVPCCLLLVPPRRGAGFPMGDYSNPYAVGTRYTFHRRHAPTKLLCKKQTVFFLHLSAWENHVYLKVPEVVIFLPPDPLMSVQCGTDFVPTGPLQPRARGVQVNENKLPSKAGVPRAGQGKKECEQEQMQGNANTWKL